MVVHVVIVPVKKVIRPPVHSINKKHGNTGRGWIFQRSQTAPREIHETQQHMCRLSRKDGDVVFDSQTDCWRIVRKWDVGGLSLFSSWGSSSKIWNSEWTRDEVLVAEASGNTVLNRVYEDALQKAEVNAKPLAGADSATKKRYIRLKYIETFLLQQACPLWWESTGICFTDEITSQTAMSVPLQREGITLDEDGK